ncbi:proline dehydrogenase family protein [Roseibacillus persicicus]|uniref:proline dehydrogenase family protein n=1 Tax=Roseibacillus persicicus TaxID=454148 RepID=UPI00398B5306
MMTMQESPEMAAATDSLAQEAITLAAKLLSQSLESETAEEKKDAVKLAAMMEDPAGKELTFHLTDRILRAPEPKRAAQLFRALLQSYGAPRYLSGPDRLLMKLGSEVSRFLPTVVMPAITERLRRESRKVILPAEEKELTLHIERRKAEQAQVNLNLLGEAVLSEEEANKRLEQNLSALLEKTTNYLSVKLSALFSQINLTAYEDTRRELSARLRLLYQAAQTQQPPAFVNLDMEEYRDLHLTLDVFREVLAEPEFLKLRAGIVLQAYLPDAFPLQQELTEWAKKRVDEGGAPIKVRLVKGANLAMEKVDAELHHWELAPYDNKADVDANYKRMLHYACKPENARAVNLGVASHNLFDLSYAMVLRKKNGVENAVEIEMLEGMAAPQARAVLAEAGKVLFYCPAVNDVDFEAAIAYLIRRLDENTTDGNFLRDLFEIAPGNQAWEKQKQLFLTACAEQDLAPKGPRRRQNRSEEKLAIQEGPFANCPDTDFSLPANREWLAWNLEPAIPVLDTALRSAADVEEALLAATSSPWPQTSQSERARLLRQAAVELGNSRGQLIAIMNKEAKKAPAEGDVEVSEAIDFANYYAHSFSDPAWQDGLAHEAIGPVVITPPWNFPCAIPCGGILAALAAGNPVIIKPAPEVIATARVMVDALWRAGIPRDALQFLPLPDNEIGQSLITDPRVAAVILTGSSLTADLFLGWRPDLRLFAETSGKNSLVITSAADPDLAIKDLVKSAFGHSGQKCSAASIALVERSLLEKTSFLTRLKDATESLKVGPATDPASIVTPLVQEPSPDLLRGLTQLDEGESWLVEPKVDENDPCLWSPGIRTGVKAGSWIHRSELFGPVLAIIPFDTLEEAVTIQNDTGFGLTGGIHSLDPVEIASWREKVEVGNAYLNRSITGAIVQRQPFGGWKNSSLGPGGKAGGPNYVSQFITPRSPSLPKLGSQPAPEVTTLIEALSTNLSPEEHNTLQISARNGSYWMEKEFSQEHDPSALKPESNQFRYRPVDGATLRLHQDSDLMDLAISAVMARLAGVELTISSGEQLPQDLAKAADSLGLRSLQESDSELSDRLTAHPLASLRTPGIPSTHLHGRNHHQPVTAHARLELLPYFLEQSLSQTLHRHGRVEEEL